MNGIKAIRSLGAHLAPDGSNKIRRLSCPYLPDKLEYTAKNVHFGSIIRQTCMNTAVGHLLPLFIFKANEMLMVMLGCELTPQICPLNHSWWLQAQDEPSGPHPQAARSESEPVSSREGPLPGSASGRGTMLSRFHMPPLSFGTA